MYFFSIYRIRCMQQIDLKCIDPFYKNKNVIDNIHSLNPIDIKEEMYTD